MNPITLEPFDELIDKLRAHGFLAAADSIAGLREAAWTTSSEMLGELGSAVLKFQADTKAIPKDIARSILRCMNEVRKVWPDIKAS